MSSKERDIIRYILNAVVAIALAVVLILGIVFGVVGPAHSAELECNECGCTDAVEQITIGGNAL